ncbi:MAG: undecaprenyl-diphosphatase UppP [Candidatus Moranbacteria bacterium]|nr:undecaprenyl-diphosphatase UppP [Candidatus Moranbacteria bacterium]
MEYLQSVILGIIQGVGEFLPISSSGHLILVPWILDWDDKGLSFDVALHFGTLLSIVAYFFKDWLEIFKMAFFRQDNGDSDIKNGKYPKKALWIIVIATIPGVLAGLFLEEMVEIIFRNPFLVAFNLIFWGAILYFSDVKAKGDHRLSDVTLKKAFAVGCAQALAIIPGTSRSGVTISMGLLCGLDRISAAKFSFLMLTPIVFGATVLKFEEIVSNFNLTLLTGIVVSAVSGYIAIKYLIKFLEKASYKIFFWYRLFLAILIVVLYLF